MYKFLSLLFLFFSICLSSQVSQIDSLKTALKKAPNDTMRAKLLASLAETAVEEEWPAYNEKLKALCESKLKTKLNGSEAKLYKSLYASAINNTAILLLQEGDLKQAEELFNTSIKLHEETGNRDIKAAVLTNLALVYETKGDVSKALECYHKGLNIREQLNDKKGIANSLRDMAQTYSKIGDIVKALSYSHKALTIETDMNDKAAMSASFNNISYFYIKQGDFQKAIEYTNKSIEIRMENGDKKGASNALNNLGTAYHTQKKYNEALVYYMKSLKMREELGYKLGIANSYNNLGELYKDKNDLKSSLDAHLKSLKTAIETGIPAQINVSYGNLGNIYYLMKNYNEALKYGKKTIQLSIKLGYPEDISTAALLLKNIYKATGNFSEALKNHELYLVMRDSIANETTRKASMKSQLKYEYDKKAAADSVTNAKQAELQMAKVKQQESELKAKRNQQYALYGGLFLVIVFAGFMYNRFRVTQKQKTIIEAKEKEAQQHNLIITQQKHLVEEKHKEITDSINYAERIQRSFMATSELLNENLNSSSPIESAGSNYFVLFKPKDVVSGDFYWAHTAEAIATEYQKTLNSDPAILNSKLFYLATADSTGHGVPGAIMSLLNITSLEKALEHNSDPAEILNATRKTIIDRLKKDGSVDGGKDGMDCSLICLDVNKKEIKIAAANNPVWIVRRQPVSEYGSNSIELIEIKPDKMPVGKHDKDQESFTTHTIELKKGDVVYTLTDGFPDQFGGEKGKKFMSKKLKEILISNSHLPMEEQKRLLEETFSNWVGNLEQIDDVTVIGIRIA